MGKKVLIHTIILLAATIVVFFWVTNEMLAYYSLQLSAVLLLTLVISHRLLRPPSFKLVESTVSTMTVLLVTHSTGAIASPLFFLNYFLLFELTFLLEPVIPLLLSGTFIMFYLLTSDSKTPLIFAELLAFPFMTPLAVVFGNIYQKMQNQRKEIHNLTKRIEVLKEELVEEEVGGKRLNHEVRIMN